MTIEVELLPSARKKRDDIRFPGFYIFFVSFNKVNEAGDETNPEPLFIVPLPKIDFSFSQHCK